MTSHEKKQVLMKYQTADKRINDLIEEKERLKAMLERTTPTYSLTSGGNNNDKLSNGVAKLIELENEINAEIEALYKSRLQIAAAMDKLPDENAKRVLYLRYIQGYRWERVALEMNYDTRWVYRLHGKALYQLDISH